MENKLFIRLGPPNNHELGKVIEIERERESEKGLGIVEWRQELPIVCCVLCIIDANTDISHRH